MNELQSEPTQQEQFHTKTREAVDRARKGAHQAQKAALATWNGAHTTAEKIVIVGGVLGIGGFFAPWYTVALFTASSSVSGFYLATHGRADFWLLPVSMAVVLLLSWLHLHSSPARRILNARWLILIGAAWSWSMISLLGSAQDGSGLGANAVSFGIYLTCIASLLILVGGCNQTQHFLNLLAVPSTRDGQRSDDLP